MSLLKRIFSSKPTCPYCDFELEKKPTRKKKCPNCENYIYVRKGELYTKEDVEIHDWLKRLSQFIVTRKDYDKHNRRLSKKFGHPASVNDTIWSILNSLATRKIDPDRKKLVYLEMASLVRAEGKDPKPYIAEATKQDLLSYKAAGIKKLKIHTANDDLVCKECRALEKKVVTIDEALSKMPIPNVCQNDNCRCTYAYELGL